MIAPSMVGSGTVQPPRPSSRRTRGGGARSGPPPAPRRGRMDLPPLDPRLEPAALLRRAERLPGSGKAVDGGVVGAAGKARVRLHVAVDGQRNSLRQLLHREVSAEVVRDRIEAAAVDEAGTAALGLGVMV